MNESQTALKPYQLEFLKTQAANNPDCKTCQRYLDEGAFLSPRHKAATGCRSGKRDHCSCGSCF